MDDCAGGKFCRTCQKTVFDFSDFTAEEYLDFSKNHQEAFCGNFKLEQTVYHTPLRKSVRQWFSGLLVYLGLSSCQDYAISTDVLKENRNTFSQQTRGVPVHNKADLQLPQRSGIRVMGKALIRDPIPQTDTIVEKSVDTNSFKPAYKFGGQEGMIAFLMENIQVKDPTSGTALLQISVGKDGIVTASNIIRSLSPATDSELIRVANLLQFTETRDTFSFQLPVHFDVEMQ
jgi:hypothetical protein